MDDNKIKVVCICNRGYYNLTEGKEYEVKEFIPRHICTKTAGPLEAFTYPRYVTVVDDDGKISTGHADRFRMLDGTSCEDYIRENIPDYRYREK